MNEIYSDLPRKLGPNVTVIDIETTGLDITHDRVWEFAAIDPFAPEKKLCGRVNPARPIPAEVVKLCGLTEHDLTMIAACPTFDKYAAALLARLHDHVVIGFNAANFDLPLLAEEFDRCGLVLDRSQIIIIDAGDIFHALEHRSLVAATKHYLARDHAGAHGAEADATATWEVFQAQMERGVKLRGLCDLVFCHDFDECQSEGARTIVAGLQMGTLPGYERLAGFSSAREIAAFGERVPRLDWSGKFVLNEEGTPCYGFGQHTKGVPVRQDVGFLRWMLTKDFPTDTLRVGRRLLDEIDRPVLAGTGNEEEL